MRTWYLNVLHLILFLNSSLKDSQSSISCPVNRLYSDLDVLLGGTGDLTAAAGPSRPLRSAVHHRSRSRSRSRSPNRHRSDRDRPSSRGDTQTYSRDGRWDPRPWEKPSHMDYEAMLRRREESIRSRRDWYASPAVPSFVQGLKQEKEGEQGNADWQNADVNGGDGGPAPFAGVGSREAIEPIFTADDLKTLTMTVPLERSTENDRKRNGRTQRRASGQQERRNRGQRQQGAGGGVVVTVKGHEVGIVPAMEVATAAPIMPGQGLQEESAVDPKAVPKPECSVLVKGIPANATNAVVRAHFGVCGPVPRVSILKKPVTGEQSDLAWVSFRSEKAANKALLLSGSSFLLEKIMVWPKESAEARTAVESMNNEGFAGAISDPFGLTFGGHNGFGGGGRGGRGRGSSWSGRGGYGQERNVFKYVRQPEGGAEAMDAEATPGNGGAAVAVKVKAEPMV